MSLISTITEMKDKFLSTFCCCSLRKSNPLWVFVFFVFHSTPITNPPFFFSSKFVVLHVFSYERLNTTLEKLKHKCSIRKHKHKHHSTIQSLVYICFSQIANSHNYLNNLYSSLKFTVDLATSAGSTMQYTSALQGFTDILLIILILFFFQSQQLLPC